MGKGMTPVEKTWRRKGATGIRKDLRNSGDELARQLADAVKVNGNAGS